MGEIGYNKKPAICGIFYTLFYFVYTHEQEDESQRGPCSTLSIRSPWKIMGKATEKRGKIDRAAAKVFDVHV